MSDTQTVLEALQELEAQVHGLIVVNAELRGQLEMAERDNDLLRARVDELTLEVR